MTAEGILAERFARGRDRRGGIPAAVGDPARLRPPVETSGTTAKVAVTALIVNALFTTWAC